MEAGLNEIEVRLAGLSMREWRERRNGRFAITRDLARTGRGEDPGRWFWDRTLHQ